jgi:hypothetical protein
MSDVNVSDILDSLKNINLKNITKKEIDDNSKKIMSLLIPLLTGVLSRSLLTTYWNRYVGLNNTEGARAKYEGLLRETKNKSDVFGYRWLLSSTHSRFPFDICDVNAGANVGYGVGIYPKNKIPMYPAHTNCVCNIEVVYKKDIGSLVNKSFRSSGINDYINGLSKDNKNRLFTKSGIKSYNNKNDFTLMQDYGGFENPKVRT